MQSEFDDDFKKVLMENTAQAVFKHLEKLDINRERFKLRWPWELLQNASDTAGPDGVKVSVAFSGDQLIFSHDGTPFTPANIGHLIYHGSTKQGDDDLAGRYGTGFMTCHLISRVVEIRGQLVDGRWFAFTLSREGASPDELNLGMSSSRAAFQSSLTSMPQVGSGNTTQFRFSVGRAIHDAVTEAIDNLERYAPFVLAFNRKLRQIRVALTDRKTAFEKADPSVLGDDFVIVPIRCTRKGQAPSDQYVVTSRIESDVQVALPLSRVADHFSVSLSADMPRLFVLFPLLGTEDFASPVVLNSTLFEPTEDRDGIYLWTSEDNSKAKRNGALLADAYKQALSIMGLARRECWGATHLLGYLPPLRSANWLDFGRYRDSVRKHLLPGIQSTPVLRIASGDFIAPKDAWIPIGRDEKAVIAIWELASKTIEGAGKVPLKEETLPWARNLVAWADIEGASPADIPGSLTLHKLADWVANCATVQTLTDRLSPGTKAYEWLTCLYDAIFASDEPHLVDDLALLPNQRGMLKTTHDLMCVRKVIDVKFGSFEQLI